VSRLIFASPQKFVETQLPAFVFPELDFEPIRLEESCGFFCLCQSGQTVSLQRTQFLFIICSRGQLALLYDGAQTD
jgi:hypothetical protein